jgi:hypothetical protein
VLHLASHYYAHNAPLFNYGEALQPVEGALHALLETQRSTDVLTEDEALRSMSAYKLVVVPEQTRLSAALLQALETYAATGGCVLMSGAHLARDCPALVGATCDGAPVAEATYLPVGQRAVAVSGPWQPVVPQGATEGWVYRLAQQEPDKDATGQVAVTRRPVGQGMIVAIHGPLFRDYVIGHYPDVRAFIDGLVRRMGVEWMVEVEAPPRLELILRRKDTTLLVNLINRGAGEMLSPHRVIVQDVPPVQDVVVRVRYPRQPRSITTVPAAPQLTWAFTDGWITAHLPRVDIHSVLAVE